MDGHHFRQPSLSFKWEDYFTWLSLLRGERVRLNFKEIRPRSRIFVFFYCIFRHIKSSYPWASCRKEHLEYRHAHHILGSPLVGYGSRQPRYSKGNYRGSPRARRQYRYRHLHRLRPEEGGRGKPKSPRLRFRCTWEEKTRSSKKGIINDFFDDVFLWLFR